MTHPSIDAIAEDKSAYERTTDYAISLTRANLLGIPLFLVLLALSFVPFGLIWGWNVFVLAVLRASKPLVWLPLLAFGVVAHEFLHGLGWMFFGKKGWESIRFGFHWKTVTPYAHCTVPLTVSAYRAGAALPGILLGILPVVAGLSMGDGIITLFGGFFLAAAAGDALSLWIMRSIPQGATVVDHPTKAGCMVLIEEHQNTSKTHEVTAKL